MPGAGDPTKAPSTPITGEHQPANRRADIDAVESAVLEALDRCAYSESSRFAVRLALEEALVNAFQHGHRGLPAETPLTVAYTVVPDEVTIAVTDQGPGFDPSGVPDPTDEANIELPSGRGLMLIRAYMTSVTHDMGGRRVTMVYRKPR
ncbi:MAG: ATP-binding protein [Phycisphaerales bacterium]